MAVQLLDTIEKTNPWYRSGKVPPRQLQDFRRRELDPLINDLSTLDFATLLLGGRRVGKSVLMYQMIDFLLQRGVSSINILFIQGDNPILREIHEEKKILPDILELYQKYIIRTQFQDLKETIYIFIDEAQSLINWDEHIKALIDLKYDVKFVVTGSSSFSLRKGAQNPLTGRVNVFFIPPFAFFDFVRFRLKSKQDEFSSKLIPLANEFQKLLLSGGDGEALLDVVKQSSEIYREFRLEKILEQYLLIGGFPKVVAGDESADMGKYLRDLLTTTIAQDISSTIRDTQAFERLMVNLALQIGSPITYKSLGDKLGIDSRVARSYLDYYIETHWACLSSPFVFHKKADSVGTDKKVYIIDSGVINTLTFKDENDVAEDTEYRGHLVENVIHNHLYYLKQQSGIFQNYIPFWIDPESRREIDFILEAKKSNIPIEVKTMDSISDPKLEAIKRFVEEKKTAHFGIVTTETRLEISEDVIFMPYSLFLLLL